MDRHIINKAAKGKLSKDNISYSRILIDISGPKANNLKDSFVRWKKAYDSNVERNKLIEDLNAPFQHDSKTVKLIKNIVKNIKTRLG